MHLQASVEGFDVFVALALDRRRDDGRCTSSPDAPMHERYQVDARLPHAGDRLGGRDDLAARERVLPLGVQLVRERSCAAREVHPIDYANASPDVALTSLHYYFPWAMEALVKWCVVLRRDRPADARSTRTQRDYFDDRRPRGPRRTRRSCASTAGSPTTYFQVAEYEEFCATALAGRATRSSSSTSRAPEFDALLVDDGARRLPGARARGDGRAAPRPRRRLGR